jgi:hypothetical protein
MGTPRVGVRQYLSAEHLWNARHMAWRCRDRQDTLATAGFRGVDMQQRSFAVSSILAAWAFLEALVNEVWQDAVDAVSEQGQNLGPNRHLGLQASAMLRLRELWQSDRVERSLGTLDKYQVALVCADKASIERGQEPYQSVDSIRMLRNALVHFKPELQWGDEVHVLKGRLVGKFEGNPLVQGEPWYPLQVLVAGCAEWCWQACLKFAETWWQRMELEYDFISVFAAWPDPTAN